MSEVHGSPRHQVQINGMEANGKLRVEDLEGNHVVDVPDDNLLESRTWLAVPGVQKLLRRMSRKSTLPLPESGIGDGVSSPPLGKPPRAYTILVTRLAVMLLLGLGIVGMAFLTWYIATAYITTTVDKLGQSVRRQAVEQSAAQFHTQLQSLSTAASILSQLLTRHRFGSAQELATPKARAVIASVTWTCFQAQSNITTLGLLGADGRAQLYVSSPDGPFLLLNNHTVAEGDNLPWDVQMVDTEGVGVGAVTQMPITPSLVIETYVTKPPAASVYWMIDSLAMFGPTLVAVREVVDGGGKRIGVTLALGPTSTLYQLLAQLQQSTQLPGALLYFSSQEGFLLAVSDNSSVQNPVSGGLLLATNSSSPVVREAAEFLNSQPAAPAPALASDPQSFSNILLGGSVFYLDTTRLVVDNLEIWGHILVPHASIMGPIEARNRLTLLVIGCTAAGLFLAGCLLVLLFTKKVSREMGLRLELIRQLEAKRKAEASSEHKTAFMANMSHELRTPMAGIIGLVDILLTEDGLSADQHDLVAQVKRCSLALLALLNNILDLSKIEAGKVVVERALFGIRAEVEDVVDMFAVQAMGGGVEIALAVDESLPPLVLGDSTRFRQILANLLSNSLKFTPQGYIAVRVNKKAGPLFLPQMDVGDDSEQCVVVNLSVEDSGCGISPNQWHAVFDSFVQADESTTRTHGGTGLGLTIVKSFVEAMHGSIGIVPKEMPGTGTKVQFHVVFAVPDAPPAYSLPAPLLTVADLSYLSACRVVLGMGPTMEQQMAVEWLTDKGLVPQVATDWPSLMAAAMGRLPPTPLSSRWAKRKGRGHYPRGATPATPTKGGGGSGVITPSKGGGSGVLTAVLGGGSGVLTAILGGASGMASSPRMGSGRLSGNADAVGGSGPLSSVSGGRGGEGEADPPDLPPVLLVVDLCLVPREVEREGSQPTAGELRAVMGQIEEVVRRGGKVGWLTVPSTPGGVRDVLASTGSLHITSRPLYTTKLAKLLVAMEGRAREAGGAKVEVKQDGGVLSQRNLREQALVAKGIAQVGGGGMEGTRRREGDGESRADKEGAILPTPPITPLPFPNTAQGDSGGGGEQGEREGKAGGEGESSVSRLPVSLGRAAPLPPPAAKPSPLKRSKDALKGVEILLAEDTPVLRKLEEIILKKMGATVKAVCDGVEAVEEVGAAAGRGHVYNVVLMDCQMPRMDGYSATQKIREDEKAAGASGGHLFIVALTAHAMASDVHKCLAVGMDAYLTKPLDSEKLITTFENLGILKPKATEETRQSLS